MVRASELVASSPAIAGGGGGAGGGGVRRPSRGRILLVDDDAATRRSLARALERFGFEVAVAADGRAALEMLAWDLGIDVVLADVVMPVMGGLTLAERVRAGRPGVGVLLMSGYEHAARSAAAPPRGVSGFLRKPVTLVELVTQLESAVGRSEPEGAPSVSLGRT